MSLFCSILNLNLSNALMAAKRHGSLGPGLNFGGKWREINCRRKEIIQTYKYIKKQTSLNFWGVFELKGVGRKMNFSGKKKEEEPSKLHMYKIPPIHKISLEEFESVAIERLKRK